MNPHLLRLLRLLQQNRDQAIADLPNWDSYGKKQLQQYAHGMQMQINELESLHPELDPPCVYPGCRHTRNTHVGTNHSFQERWKSDMMAIKRWQEEANLAGPHRP